LHCAAANVARHGVFAAIMATEGMTAPAPPFEDGLTAMTGPAAVSSFPLDPDGFSTLKLDYKYFRSNFHTHRMPTDHALAR
jgi:2-methylcitrate dehydratase PrpD